MNQNATISHKIVLPSEPQVRSSALLVRAYFAHGWNRAWTIAENECRDVKRLERITKRAIRANLAFKVDVGSSLQPDCSARSLAIKVVNAAEHAKKRGEDRCPYCQTVWESSIDFKERHDLECPLPQARQVLNSRI